MDEKVLSGGRGRGGGEGALTSNDVINTLRLVLSPVKILCSPLFAFGHNFN